MILFQPCLEVKDISYSGMQVFTTNEIPHLVVGKEYNGVLCWKGEHLNVKGKLKWVKNRIVPLLSSNLIEQMDLLQR